MSLETVVRCYGELEPDAQRVLLHVANVESLEKLGAVWPYRDNARRYMLVLVAERLVMGRKQYGDLNLAADTRDFLREAHEEEADMLIYYGCAALKAGRR